MVMVLGRDLAIIQRLAHLRGDWGRYVGRHGGLVTVFRLHCVGLKLGRDGREHGEGLLGGVHRGGGGVAGARRGLGCGISWLRREDSDRGGGGGVLEGSQGDGVNGHVVLPHEVGQLLPRHHLVILGQLVHGDQLVAGGQRRLRRGVEWSAGVKR